MPARRRKKSRNRKRKSFPKWVFPAFILLSLFIFIFIHTKYWGKNLNLAVVSPSDSGVVVRIFNQTRREMYIVNIPGNTQVETAHDLGTWRIGSVWQLGINEKLGGRLLSDTVIKNFMFPVGVWAGSDFNKIINGNFIEILGSVIFSKRTNLGVGDRVRIAYFSHKIKDFQRYNVDLADTKFLERTKLKDGKLGFIVTNDFSQKLLPAFAEFEKGKILISVFYEFEDKSIANNIARTLETMGAKPILIKKVSPDYYPFSDSCLVRGDKSGIAERVASIFSCGFKSDLDKGGNIEIILGKGFSERF